MKITMLVITGILLLMSAATLSAQNALPNPNNSACWQSLSSLRACQLAQYEHEIDYAQRCTSYPEYQCLPATEQKNRNPETAATVRKAGRSQSKAGQKATSPTDGFVAVSAGSNGAN